MKKILKKTVVLILTAEARLVLKKYKPYIIAVTGSVGKTGTKDAIFTALEKYFFVRKSEKSFNSEIGVPLAILGCPNAWGNVLGWCRNFFAGALLILFKHNFPKYLILEVGADRPGDIEKIAKWLLPDLVVVTRLAPVPAHVEFFSTPEKVVAEKTHLVKAVKDNGAIILCADDDDVLAMQSLVRREVMTFGMARDADLRWAHEKIDYEGRLSHRFPVGISFKIIYKEENILLKIKGSVGRQNIYAILASVAVGVRLGVSLEKLALALSGHRPPNGRMKIIEAEKSALVIDDSYNSSPVAVREALETLKTIETRGRKIAVLGDMLELGKYSIVEHRDVGKISAGVANIIITVGLRARDIAEGVLQAGFEPKNIIQVETSAEAGIELEKIIGAGDIVLIKGSQGVRMEKIVEEVMAHPENKNKLLVRQDDEWQKKL